MSDETNNPAAEPETPAGEAAPAMESAQAEIDAGFAVIGKLSSENADLRDKLLRAIADGKTSASAASAKRPMRRVMLRPISPVICYKWAIIFAGRSTR
jgi:hypothetical protein